MATSLDVGSRVLGSDGRAYRVASIEVDKAYDPNQPRVPRGDPRGGQWTSAGGASGASAGAGAEPEAWTSVGVDPATVPGAEHAGGVPAYLDLIANKAQLGRPSVDGFILAHGRGYPLDEDSLLGGEPHQCYKNSLLATMADPDLTYVEGYVSIHGVPIHHAWTVDREGRVRDHTLGEDARHSIKGYFGVPVRSEFALAETMRRGRYGILINERHEAVMRAGPGKIVERAALAKHTPGGHEHDQQTHGRRASSDIRFPFGVSKDQAHRDNLLAVAREVAADLDFDPDRIKLVEGRKAVMVGDTQYTVAGTADVHGDMTISLYPEVLRDYSWTRGLVAHEIMHIKFQTALEGYYRESRLISDLPKPAGIDDVMHPSGKLKSPYDAQFPTYQAMLAALYPEGGGVHGLFERTDGVTPYSFDWWRAAKDQKADTMSAYHETLAEMARIKYTTGKFPEHMGPRVISYRGGLDAPRPTAKEIAAGTRAWRDLYRTVERVWSKEGRVKGKTT